MSKVPVEINKYTMVYPKALEIIQTDGKMSVFQSYKLALVELKLSTPIPVIEDAIISLIGVAILTGRLGFEVGDA